MKIGTVTKRRRWKTARRAFICTALFSRWYVFMYSGLSLLALLRLLLAFEDPLRPMLVNPDFPTQWAGFQPISNPARVGKGQIFFIRVGN